MLQIKNINKNIKNSLLQKENGECTQQLEPWREDAWELRQKGTQKCKEGGKKANSDTMTMRIEKLRT